MRLVALPENAGFARANAIAARYARGRYLLLLNPDTVVLDGAIDRLVAERGARRGQGNLLDVLEELPEPIPGPPSGEILDELRSERL